MEMGEGCRKHFGTRKKNHVVDGKEVKKKTDLKERYGKGVIKENIQIYAMMLPTLLLIFVFCYIPLYGLIISFQDYVPGSPFLGPDVEWVGLKWFEKFISGHYFTRLIRNTLVLSGLHFYWISFGIPDLKSLYRLQATCPILFLLWWWRAW